MVLPADMVASDFVSGLWATTFPVGVQPPLLGCSAVKLDCKLQLEFPDCWKSELGKEEKKGAEWEVTGEPKPSTPNSLPQPNSLPRAEFGTVDIKATPTP